MILPTIFQNEEHAAFFEKAHKRYTYDAERLSLFYLLGLDEIRPHLRDFYNFDSELISYEGFKKPYLTSSMKTAVLLAFSLYGAGGEIPGRENFTPSLCDIRAGIANQEYLPFFIEAMKIAYGHPRMFDDVYKPNKK